jgi:hypothetical protein
MPSVSGGALQLFDDKALNWLCNKRVSMPSVSGGALQPIVMWVTIPLTLSGFYALVSGGALQRMPFCGPSDLRVCGPLRGPTRKWWHGRALSFKQASDQLFSPRRPRRKTTFAQTSVPALKTAPRSR